MRAFIAGFAGLSGTVKQKPVLDATGVGAGIAAQPLPGRSSQRPAFDRIMTQVVHRTVRAPS
jgi:hypothetical protein